jgi:hypothetical protein
MKVKELIEKLQVLDPEIEVMRLGYRNSVESVISLDVALVPLKVNEIITAVVIQ